MTTGSLSKKNPMRWLLIKSILTSIFIICFFTAVASEVHATIPLKKICVKNDKDQLLLFNGQPLWVRQNNATGTMWFKQGEADGCALFNSDDKFQDQWFKKDNNVDMNFDGVPDGATFNNNGNEDMGCASGPFGFQVVMPKEWEKDWKCETVGTTNGPFPCCRNPEEKQYVPNCNACPVNTQGYQGEQTTKQCYCDRSAHNGGLDAECPICFHNDGVEINVTLHCKRSKTSETKTVDKPAATQFASKANQALSCLKTELCSDTDPLRKCQSNVNTASGTRRVLLEGVRERKQTLLPAQPTKPFWLVECLIEGAALQNATYICTTGSSATDVQALGVDNFSKLKATYGYSSSFYSQDGSKITQPIQDTQSLLDTYEWETTTSKLTSSVFMGVYDSGSTGAATVGSSSGQQQATLSFSDDCTLVQDPFGHVFDSHTLEPLANAAVEITQKNLVGNFEKINMQETGIDGKYSFYVKDGAYKLNASKANYTFPGKPSNLNANVSQFYSNLYHGEEIVQNGKPEMYDIPLDPVNKQWSEEYAKKNPARILSYFQTVHKQSKDYVIEGQVSHPRAIVVAYAGATDSSKPGSFVKGRALTRTEADNSGFFKISVPFSSLKEDEFIRQLEAIRKNSQSKDSVSLNPLFNSIKGFAYDAKGSLIPGATVEVLTAVSDKPVFTTHADSRGYFSIDSRNLPPLEISLRFTSLNNTVDTVSSGTFLAQNTATTVSKGKNSTIALAKDANGDVLGISSSSEEPDKPPFSTRVWFILAILLAILIGSVYKVYRHQ